MKICPVGHHLIIPMEKVNCDSDKGMYCYLKEIADNEKRHRDTIVPKD